MRSGVIAWIQYLTAILMIFLVSWHLIVRIPWVQGVESFTETMQPSIVYEEISRFWPLLLLLVIVVVVHGVNGVRSMLLEWVVDGRMRLVINILAVLATIALILVGVHTIVGVSPP